MSKVHRTMLTCRYCGLVTTISPHLAYSAKTSPCKFCASTDYAQKIIELNDEYSATGSGQSSKYALDRVSTAQVPISFIPDPEISKELKGLYSTKLSERINELLKKGLKEEDKSWNYIDLGYSD